MMSLGNFSRTTSSTMSFVQFSAGHELSVAAVRAIVVRRTVLAVMGTAVTRPASFLPIA